jgi:hypothetical protein
MQILRPVLITALAVFLFSCERAVQESSKVSIQLPVSSSKAVTFSGPATTGPVAPSDEEKPDEFLSLQPTEYAGEYPINCYAVVVGAEATSFKKNYCGQKDASTAVSHDLEFGPIVGLIPEGGVISFDLDIGKARQFYVLGFHAINAQSCRDLAQQPEKYNLSKPYLIGKSGPVDLVGGDQNVVIKLGSVSGSSSFDDCVITEIDSDLKYPVADSIKVVKNSFPYSVLRVPPPTGYDCEPLSIFLKQNGGRATVGGVTNASIAYSPTASGFTSIVSYDSNADCINGTNGSNNFLFFKNQTDKVRWVQTLSSWSTAYFQAKVGNLIDQLATTVYSSLSQQIVDTVVPKLVEPGKCYKLASYIKDINGLESSLSATANINVTGGTATFFSTLANCIANTPVITQVIFPTSSKIEYYVRTNTSSTNFTVTLSYGALHDDGARISYPNSVIDSTTIVGLRFQGQAYVPDNPSQCNRIQVMPIDTNGRVQASTVGGRIKFSLESSELAGVQLYTDATCSSILPAEPALGNPVTIGSNYIEYYYKATNGTFGPGHLQFLYSNGNGTVTGRFNFEIIDKNY